MIDCIKRITAAKPGHPKEIGHTEKEPMTTPKEKE